MRARALACGLSGVLALTGCAHRAQEVGPLSINANAYADWPCERLHDELDAVQQRAADVAYAVDARAGNNMIALGLGLTVFWPALLAMRPDGPEAAMLADLKGRDEALRRQARQLDCPPPPETMAARRAADLPVVVGDRLVYDERPGHGRIDHPGGLHGVASGQTLGLRVTALKRDRIEFGVDRNGQALPGVWTQDLAGNTRLDGGAPLLHWQRLLRPGLELGQVLSGQLSAANDPDRTASLRGQVVAIGPQRLDGRDFDVAVIELFGEVHAQLGRDGTGGRLDGVMAVDRRSGILLRLDLRCAQADFALRRRLLRVEPAVAAASTGSPR